MALNLVEDGSLMDPTVSSSRHFFSGEHPSYHSLDRRERGLNPRSDEHKCSYFIYYCRSSVYPTGTTPRFCPRMEQERTCQRVKANLHVLRLQITETGSLNGTSATCCRWGPSRASPCAASARRASSASARATTLFLLEVVSSADSFPDG